MSIRVEPRPEAVVVRAERSLGVVNRHALRSAVVAQLENGCAWVVIDFGETEVIDSGGLGLLVSLHRAARERGARLVLANLPNGEEDGPSAVDGGMAALLTLTKLDTVLSVAGTVEEALSEAAAPEPTEGFRGADRVPGGEG